MSNSARRWMFLFGVCVSCVALGGCGKAKQQDVSAASGASAPKIYSVDDVNNELKDGQVAMGGSGETARAFFQSHANYHVCKDMESMTIAVVQNSKVDKHADDIYVVARYNRDGTVGAMDVTLPQFSVGDLTSYCK